MEYTIEVTGASELDDLLEDAELDLELEVVEDGDVDDEDDLDDDVVDDDDVVVEDDDELAVDVCS